MNPERPRGNEKSDAKKQDADPRGDLGTETVTPGELPVALPPMLQGLETLVYTEAAKLADPQDAEAFARAVNVVVSEVEHQAATYVALGRIA